MSLLLDALKKSEAQRRRGKPPAVDLANTPPSIRSGRSGWRWLLVILPVVLLAAAAPWLWPEISSRLAGGPGADNPAAQRTGDAAVAEANALAGRGESQVQVASASIPAEQASPSAEPAPVAGAERMRRAASAEGNAADKDATDKDAAEVPAQARADESTTAQQQAAPNHGQPSESAPDAEPRPKPSPAAVRESEPEPGAEPEPEPEPEPRENFIRAWELPQAQRAEFPELNLTVHFYSQEPRDRFVLINGERYAEGQLVQRGVKLAEIRRRGAVVDFAGYRVLIE